MPVGDARERVSLVLAAVAPFAELPVEPRLLLAAIFVILAIELVDLAFAPVGIGAVAGRALLLGLPARQHEMLAR